MTWVDGVKYFTEQGVVYIKTYWEIALCNLKYW